MAEGWIHKICTFSGIVNLILSSKDRDELVEQIGARLVALREALEADPIKIPLEAFQILKVLLEIVVCPNT